MFNQEMAEGSEDDGFWGALGGQADYQKARDLDKPLLYPRLFHCTISPAGCLRVNEVSNFGQEVSALGKICFFFFFVLSSWLLIPSSVMIVIAVIIIIILCVFISQIRKIFLLIVENFGSSRIFKMFFSGS